MADEHTITVTENGPYRISPGLPISAATGEAVGGGDRAFLCRCGQSGRKPFCDGTHARVGFVGTEVADRGPMSARQESYEGDGITIHDDRALCAHAGRCTAGLASVWRYGQEPWIDPHGATRDEIAAVVGSCPSGALTYSLHGRAGTVEEALAAAVVAVPNGPYRVTGAVTVTSHGGHRYEQRNRQTLCRCGQSQNKPFCDGSHWNAGFRDPA